MDLSRVLIIKPSSLGDVVQALPVAWALRRLNPGARIDWLVTPGCAGIVDGLEAINHVVLFDRARYGHIWKNPAALVSFGWFLHTLRRVRYTAVVDLQGLFRSGFLAWTTGARHRIGLGDSREGADRFYNHLVKVPADKISSVDRYMEAAFELGVPRDEPRRFDIHVPATAQQAADELLAAGGLGDRPYVVLVPGARWHTKRWPEERFSALASRLHEKLGTAPVLVGAPGDSEISDRMSRLQGRNMIDLIGKTDIKTLAAVLRGARCVVTNDTGPMHLASALGTTVIAIFGPTDVTSTGPYGEGHVTLAEKVPCAPCYGRSCQWEGGQKELMCQRAVTVDEVFDTVKLVLARSSGGVSD